MKSLFQRISSVFLVLAMFVLAGCASNGQVKSTSLGEGDKVFATAVIRVDRLVTKTSELEGTVYELDAVQIGFKEPDGKWVTYFDKELKREVPAITRFHRETRTTPFGQTVTLTFVSGVLPTIIQGEYAKQLAKQTACKPGSICADNVNINEATATGGLGLGIGGAGGSSGAIAGSNSSSLGVQETNVDVSNGGGGKPNVPTPCKTCGTKPQEVK